MELFKRGKIQQNRGRKKNTTTTKNISITSLNRKQEIINCSKSLDVKLSLNISSGHHLFWGWSSLYRISIILYLIKGAMPAKTNPCKLKPIFWFFLGLYASPRGYSVFGAFFLLWKEQPKKIRNIKKSHTSVYSSKF